MDFKGYSGIEFAYCNFIELKVPGFREVFAWISIPYGLHLSWL